MTFYETIIFKCLVFILAAFLSSVASASNVPDEAKKEQVLKQMHGVHVPFVENKGQIKNDEVKFYAKTFSGTVFAEENGSLSYSLPAEDNKGILLKEIFTDKKMNIEGLDPSPTSVNYFIGKDKNNWGKKISQATIAYLWEKYMTVLSSPIR